MAREAGRRPGLPARCRARTACTSARGCGSGARSVPARARRGAPTTHQSGDGGRWEGDEHTQCSGEGGVHGLAGSPAGLWRCCRRDRPGWREGDGGGGSGGGAGDGDGGGGGGGVAAAVTVARTRVGRVVLQWPRGVERDARAWPPRPRHVGRPLGAAVGSASHGCRREPGRRERGGAQLPLGRQMRLTRYTPPSTATS